MDVGEDELRAKGEDEDDDEDNCTVVLFEEGWELCEEVYGYGWLYW